VKRKISASWELTTVWQETLYNCCLKWEAELVL